MNLGVNDRFNFAATVPPAEQLGPVHFIAIGGSGMSGVARMFLDRGVAVSGSDSQDSETLRELEAAGATVHVGHDPAHLGEARTVVVSSAVREDNPELAAAREQGLVVLHRSQGIAALLYGADTVAVAGANGKTTTSAMAVVALQAAGADPSYVIGAAVGRGPSAARGRGSAFVVEADESDGSFVVYHPQVAVVTNVKPDHLDFYGGLDLIEDAFTRFAGTVREGGLLVACADDEGARRLAERYRLAGGTVATYGTVAEADLRLERLRPDAATATADLVWARDLGPVTGGSTKALSVPMPGAHNLMNAAAALLAVTAGLGVDVDRALAGLAGYPGAHRRFERVGAAAGVTVVDDYAHNPDKVAAVVAAGRGLVADPDSGLQRLVVLFQPHLYSRTRDFADGFADALAPADVVVLMDVYGAREDPVPGVDGDTIGARLRDRRDRAAEVHYVAERDAVVPALADLVRPGDLVLTVGAGDVTRLGPPLLDELRRREGGQP